MFELIYSKDYKKYLEDNNIELSDWDKAALIYHHELAEYDEKAEALRELMKTTADDDLKKQIEQRLSRDYWFYQKFKENTGNSYYLLSERYEKEYMEGDAYLDFSSAFNDGVKGKYDFCIEKILFKCRKNAGETDGVFGSISFNAQGNVGNLFCLYSIKDGDCLMNTDCNRFEEHYIDLPFMFRQGELVHIIGTELYGIIDFPENDEEELKYRQRAKNGEYCDFQVTVDLMFEGQKFLPVSSHVHCAPTYIEYAKFDTDDVRKGFMEYMAKKLYCNPLSEGTEKDEGRIGEVLSYVGKVWKQFPDMSLGQLLINVTGSSDLYSVDDEQLMERLQYNSFK